MIIQGRVDLEYFEQLISKHQEREAQTPAIINANVGSTTYGGIDNIPTIRQILDKYQINYTLHMDAAFLGSVLPLLKPFGQDIKNYVKDLGVHTFVVSGHKFLSTPRVVGVVCAEQSFIQYASRNNGNHISNTETFDGRDGFNIILMHYFMNCVGMYQQDYKLLTTLFNASTAGTHYLYQKLQTVFDKGSILFIPKQLHISFPKPSEEIQEKYFLMPISKDRSGISVTSKVTEFKVNNLVKNLIQENSNSEYTRQL